MPPHIDSDSESRMDDEIIDVEPTVGERSAKLKAAVKPSEDSEDEIDNKQFTTPDRGKGYVNGRQDGDEEEDDEDDEDDGEEDEVYVVERIIKHAVAENDAIIYQVKWKDYPNSENTWETEANLEGAKDLLKAYFQKIGGRPTDETNPRDANRKRGRRSLGGSERIPSKRSKAEEAAIRQGHRKSGKPEDVEEAINWPAVKVNSDWKPPKPRKDTWEDILLKIEALEVDDNNQKWAFVLWAIEDENGVKRTSKVLLQSVSIAAPQAAIRFYEEHLVFTQKNGNGEKEKKP